MWFVNVEEERTKHVLFSHTIKHENSFKNIPRHLSFIFCTETVHTECWVFVVVFGYNEAILDLHNHLEKPLLN